MNGKIKITLVDFDDMVYVVYVNGRQGLSECLTKLGNSHWKSTYIQPVK